MKFSNQYHQLGQGFYQQTLPVPVVKPSLLMWNTELASQLSMTYSPDENEALLAQIFSGNQIPDGATPIALAYSGHQFGQFNPQLGDGRAHLLGELTDTTGQVRDIQLKGSGITSFSRRGDGRCALGPALREYIMSEAMQALGVPTSRCLAVVASGESVYRETALPGAIVTRVASSHLRVGTFQYFSARGDSAAINTLIDFAIKRHFPEITATDSKARALAFLSAVIDKQLSLVLAWLRVGFIHGVMNTDNTAISGETIDFGPCAMMGAYNPDQVFSSIDAQGRYAFANQPNIVQWNMGRLASCLLPILADNDEDAVAMVMPIIRPFSEKFQQGYFTMMSDKLGLVEDKEGDAQLINDLLAVMQSKQLDFTQTFADLTRFVGCDEKQHHLVRELGDWFIQWQARVNPVAEQAKALMQKNNPVVIPRNHHVEAVLASCQETGDMQAAHDFLKVLKQPYTQQATTKNYQGLSPESDQNYRTFCGT